jgi:branched-chain amino acid transport system substrate-binding protein
LGLLQTLALFATKRIFDLRNRHSFSLLIIMLTLLLLLAACGGGQAEVNEAPTVEAQEDSVEPVAEEPAMEQTPAAEAEAEIPCAEPVKVGLITDITGPLAIYGVQTLRSFPLGLEYLAGTAGVEGDDFTSYMVDGCEIQVYIRDDQSSPETTATVGRELVESVDVDILVGTVSSGATATLQELARDNNIIHVAVPAAANDLTGANFNENSFRTSRNNYQDAANGCSYLSTQFDKFVLVVPDYSLGYGFSEALRDACTLNGGEFVVDDIFAPLDTTDFTAYMEQVVDAIDDGAQVLIVLWPGAGMIPLLQAAADLGVTDEITVTPPIFYDHLSVPTIHGNSIGSTSGIAYHYTFADNAINDWLVAQTTDRFGVPPDLYEAESMNAAILIVEALRASGGDATADALIPVMEGMEFEGPKGMVTIRQEDHVAIQDMYIAKLLNVDDPNFEFFEYVDTVRPDVPCLLPEDLQERCGDLPIGTLSGE